MIITAAEAYEKVTLKALDSWLSEMSIPLYVVGPLLPPTYGSDAASSYVDEGDVEFKTFLNSMLSQHGEKSVVFVRGVFSLVASVLLTQFMEISFGTVYFPIVPGYLDEILEAFLEKKVPFVRLKKKLLN